MLVVPPAWPPIDTDPVDPAKAIVPAVLVKPMLIVFVLMTFDPAPRNRLHPPPLLSPAPLWPLSPTTIVLEVMVLSVLESVTLDVARVTCWPTPNAPVPVLKEKFASPLMSSTQTGRPA